MACDKLVASLMLPLLLLLSPCVSQNAMHTVECVRGTIYHIIVYFRCSHDDHVPQTTAAAQGDATGGAV